MPKPFIVPATWPHKLLIAITVTAPLLWAATVAVFGFSFGARFWGVLLVLGLGVAWSHDWQAQGRPLPRSVLRLRQLAYGGAAAGTVLWLAVAWLLLAGHTQPVPAAATHLIVLGAGLRDGDQLSRVLQTRLDCALQLLHTHPRLQVVVSGGQGADERISEAEAMRRYLVSRGVAPGRILVEDRSTTTQENLRFSQALLHRHGSRGPWVIVSSDFHVRRARRLAAQEQMVVTTAGGATPVWILPAYLVREALALAKMELSNAMR